MELTTPHHKKPACYKMLHVASEVVGSCEDSNVLSGSINDREFQKNSCSMETDTRYYAGEKIKEDEIGRQRHKWEI